MKHKILKALFFYIPVMASAFLLLYFAGHFVPLHENAYGDIFRSVTVSYAAYLLYLLWKGRHSNPSDTSDSAVPAALGTAQQKKPPSSPRSQGALWLKAKARFFKEQNVVYDIFEAFMLVTVINSFMMVSGIDSSPKAGKFAYIHLMIRLAIIAGIMAAVRGRKTIGDIKNMFFFFQKNHRDSVFRHCLSPDGKLKLYACTYVLYTLVTILICLFTILFFENPTGGIPFYTFLIYQFIAIAGLLGILKILISIWAHTRSDSGSPPRE